MFQEAKIIPFLPLRKFLFLLFPPPPLKKKILDIENIYILNRKRP